MKQEFRVFDGHCDTVSRCYASGCGLRQNDGHLDLERAVRFGGYAQFFALFWDAGKTGSKPLRQIFAGQRDLLCRELAGSGDLASFCATGAQACSAMAEGKVAAFLSVEEPGLLDWSVEGLAEAHRLGVRAVNLTWNHANPLSGSNVEQPERGLSPTGREFVGEMERLGMLVDVSHLSDPGFWDVAEVARRPFFASHSNARALCPHPRNLTDEMFTTLVRHGGVAGLNLYADFLGERADVDTVVAHLEHFLELGGARSVALGGDWDGCSLLPRGLGGIEDLGRLHERLLQRNYSPALIDAVFYDNLMRVVNEVCIM